MNNSFRIQLLLFFIIGSFILTGSSCMHGGSAVLRFKKLEYPASMSPYLYDANWKKLKMGSELEFIKKATVTKKVWGIGYGMIPLSGSSAIDRRLNEDIKKHKGVGIVNVAVSTRGCSFNGALPFLSFIPIIPGCGIVTVEGDIVKK